MDVAIKRKGLINEELLSKYGVYAQDFVVESIPMITNYTEVDGRPGVVDYGAEYGQRTIRVPFYIKAEENSPRDFPRVRDRLIALLTGKTPLEIREMRREERELGEDGIVDGKKYVVRLQDVLAIDQQLHYGFGEMVFVTVGMPFGISVNNPKRVYKADFDFNYEGNVGIDLIYSQESAIVFRGVSDQLTIKNESSGSEWRYFGRSTASDVIELRGPRATKNGLTIFADTNRRSIVLVPGVNTFTVTGATYYEIEVTVEQHFL